MQRVRWGLGDLGTITLNAIVFVDCCACIVLVDKIKEDEANWFMFVVRDGEVCKPGSLPVFEEVDDEEQEVDDVDMRRWLLFWLMRGVVVEAIKKR